MNVFPRAGVLTALVTGGAGFLGSHLCRKLLESGDRVICVDDLSTGLLSHVDALRANPRFRFIRHDVTEPMDLKVDRIFNLACPASPPAYQADPIHTTMTNVLGVRNMLELARANGARILHASTSEVYGDPMVHPQTEDYRGNVVTMGPRACYDEGKRCAETLLHDYHRIHGVDVRVARIFNTYGPGMRQDDGRAMSNFVVQALTGRPITVYGDGSYTRSLCYVDDLIRGLLRLMSHDAAGPAPFNLGNPTEISVLELAHRVIAATGTRAPIIHLPEAIDDPKIRCPDISRAMRELDWRPVVPLSDGLQRTIEHFRRELDSARELVDA